MKNGPFTSVFDGMTASMRIFLYTGGILLAIALVCLGLETIPGNVMGWVVALVGVLYLSVGVFYLWTHREHKGAKREEQGDRSFWLIIPGFIAVFMAPPLEWLYLPELLPRILPL